MSPRPIRDRLAEALRLRSYGADGEWEQVPITPKDFWRGEADVFLRLASECGLEIREKGRPDD